MYPPVWIWILIAITIAAIVAVIIRTVRRRRQPTTKQVVPSPEEQRYKHNCTYRWLKRVEATNEPMELNNLWHEWSPYSYTVSDLGDELKERFNAAREKAAQGTVRYEADVLIAQYGQPSELEPDKLDQLYRALVRRGSEAIATLLDINLEQARESTHQRIREQYASLCAALLTGRQESFLDLMEFLKNNEDYVRNQRIDGIVRPPGWDQWVTFHIPIPTYDDFVSKLMDTHNEIAFRAAEALRTKNMTLAKLVLASLKKYRGKDTIGENFYEQLIKMVDLHNSKPDDQRLAEIGLVITSR